MADKNLEKEYQDYLEYQKYLKAQPPAPQKSSAVDAALTGVQDGALLGARPAIGGIGGAIGETVGEYQGAKARGEKFGLGQLVDAAKKGFSESRADVNSEQQKLQEQNPGVYSLANLGGAIATSPLLPITSLKGAIGVGAGTGALNAASSADSLKDAASDIGIGAAGGMAGFGAGKVLNAGAQKLGQSLEGLGEKKAFKAAGAMLKDFRQAFNKDDAKVKELGKTMFDNGLIKIADSVDNIAERSEALRRDTGQKIGEVYNKVLDHLTDPAIQIDPELRLNIEAAGFHPKQQADEIKSLVFASLKGKPGSTQAIHKANQVIDELALNGDHVTPQTANELKSGVDTMINWSKKAADLPLDQDALKIVRSYIQERVNTQISLLDSVLGSNQSKELMRLNKLYGNVSTIANIAKDKVSRNNANAMLGLRSTILAGGGAVPGAYVGYQKDGPTGALTGALKGAAIGGASQLLINRGNSALSTVSKGLGAGLSNMNAITPSVLGSQNALQHGAIKRRLQGQ